MMKALFISSFIAGTSSAFQTQPGFSPQRLHDTAIAATINNNPTTEESLSTSRRNILQGAGVAMTALLGGTVLSQPAEAKYSTYTRYEEDWKERQEKGGKGF